MTAQLSPTALEEAAKAISISTGDEPDKLTYAREMQCSGNDREPQYRWQYWTEHATAAITAYLAQREKEGFVEVPKEASEEVVNAALDKHAEITPCESPFGPDGYFALLYRAMLAAAEDKSCK